MRLRVADPVSRGWLTNIVYILLEEEEFEYAFTFHNLEVRAVKQPFAVCNGLVVPAGVGTTEDMQIIMLLYYPIVSRLSHRSQITVLKHELLHVVEGHMSSYGQRLTEDYGMSIANTAKDIYVNQRLTAAELDALTDDGLPPCRAENHKLPLGLSSEEYCQLLQDKESAGEKSVPKGDIRFVSDDEGKKQDGDAQAGTGGKPGDPFDGKGEYRPSEAFDLDDKNASTADQATREVIESVTQSLKARGKEWRKERGFHGSDHSAFVEAAERQSRVPWYYYLRVLESKNRAETVVPTRRRPSRRCPSHMGRVRRYGLDVAFMIDTSGSMSAEQLRLVDAELRGLHSRGAHIRVIHCDAHVAKTEPYSPFTPMERFYGRGGTDFSPALLMLRDMYPRPGLFVGFTDGAGSIGAYTKVISDLYGQDWYDAFASHDTETTPDGIDAVWLLPEGCMTPDEFKSIAPWGHRLVVPTDRVQENE